MSYEMRSVSLTTPEEQTHIRVEQLYPRVNKSLQQWGRYSHACYRVFQEIVELKLKIVEKRAEKEVRLEGHKVDCQREVMDLDRQKAVWSLLREAIIGLEPSLLKFDRRIMLALQQLPQTGQWPQNVTIPPECWGYLVVSFAYVWKTKNTREVARLLGIPKASMRTIRTDAVREVVQRLQAWEQKSHTL